VAEQPFDKEIMRATPESNYIIQQKLIIDIWAKAFPIRIQREIKSNTQWRKAVGYLWCHRIEYEAIDLATISYYFSRKGNNDSESDS
jgi:hypothetical protein